MLTKKELKYVDSWANKIPMPGYEYSLKILNRMEECYKLHKEMYQNKEYNILFSNSDEIDIAILEKNLCHMLGVDFNNIRSDYFEKYRKEAFNISDNNFDSYHLLELIFENKERVSELDNDPNNQAKAINYYKSSIKCDIFSKLSDFSKFNFLYIDIDSEKDMKNLVVASNEELTPYFAMGIVKSNAIEDNGIYVVNTLIAPTEPKKIFENKTVAIPTQIIISDNANLNKINATPEEKIQLLTMYSNILNKYNIENRINIYGDYENMLNELGKQKNKTLN